MLGTVTSITASTVSVNELWLGVKVATDPEMTPRQRIGSTVYALVAEQLANPKNPTIVLSHDGILKSDITCSTPKNQLVIWGAGFESNESVSIQGVDQSGVSTEIFTAVADDNGVFMKQGSSSAPAISCSAPGPLMVTSRGDKGSVAIRPVLISATPTPGPTATPAPTATPIAVTPTPVPTTIINSQILTTTTTWTLSGSPYLVKGNVRVDQGVTLTIEPGVDIRFTSEAGLEILGTLKAIGTATQTISFAPTSEAWRGIQFRNTGADSNESNVSVIDWSHIDIGEGHRNSDDPISITIQASSTTISNSVIEGKRMKILISIEIGGPTLSDNVIRCSVNFCETLIQIRGGNELTGAVTITGNSIMFVDIASFAIDATCRSIGNLVIDGNAIVAGSGRVGVSLRECQSVTIKGNTITGWEQVVGAGISLTERTSTHSGIPVLRTIARNTFDSNGVGIKLDGVFESNSMVITQNNFTNNTKFAVELENVTQAVSIEVSDSYWGTTDPTAISDLIFDNLDDFNLGTVSVVNPVPNKIDISSE
jgi:hypothetical protein